jgi:hypothetical protein
MAIFVAEATVSFLLGGGFASDCPHQAENSQNSTLVPHCKVLPIRCIFACKALHRSQ